MPDAPFDISASIFDAPPTRVPSLVAPDAIAGQLFSTRDPASAWVCACIATGSIPAVAPPGEDKVRTIAGKIDTASAP